MAEICEELASLGIDSAKVVVGMDAIVEAAKREAEGISADNVAISKT
jgi:hypothetical protein